MLSGTSLDAFSHLTLKIEVAHSTGIFLGNFGIGFQKRDKVFPRWGSSRTRLNRTSVSRKTLTLYNCGSGVLYFDRKRNVGIVAEINSKRDIVAVIRPR